MLLISGISGHNSVCYFKLVFMFAVAGKEQNLSQTILTIIVFCLHDVLHTQIMKNHQVYLSLKTRWFQDIRNKHMKFGHPSSG